MISNVSIHQITPGSTLRCAEMGNGIYILVCNHGLFSEKKCSFISNGNRLLCSVLTVSSVACPSVAESSTVSFYHIQQPLVLRPHSERCCFDQSEVYMV